MARRKEDLEKVTIRLNTGDKDELDEFYPQLGYTRVVRSLVSAHIKMLRARAQAKVEASSPSLDVEITSEEVSANDN